MSEILDKQLLEVENLVCFRGKVSNAEMQLIGKDIENKINNVGMKRVGHPITAIYGTDGDRMDVEILIPVNNKLSGIEDYNFKEKILIENAVVAKHKGNPMKLQDTCNELNQYIVDNKLVPITVGYNVTQKVGLLNTEDVEIDIYVGVSPNIL